MGDTTSFCQVWPNCWTVAQTRAMKCHLSLSWSPEHAIANMGDMLKKTHWWQCTTSSFFLLLADQSKDTSKKEQLAVVVRHVNDKAIFNEWFLTFVEATSLTAKSLTTYFTFTLTEDGLDPALIDLRDTMELLSGVEAVPVCSSNWEKYLHVLHISTAHKLCSCWLHKEHSVHLRSFLSAWGSI